MDASRQTAPTPDPDDGLPVLIVDDQAPFRSAARAVVRRINGVEATRRILATEPDTVVVLCSTYNPQDLPPDVPSSGARAYINKEEFGPAELLRIWSESQATRGLPAEG
jgi:CheY-like chemotaxis protein